MCSCFCSILPPHFIMQEHDLSQPPFTDDDEPKAKLLSQLDTMDVIFECGKVQLPFEQIALILNDRLSRPERIELLAQLNDNNSPQFQAYARGMAEGDAQLKISLHGSASAGDSDAYKNLNAEQRKNAINESIRKNFGIGDSD